MFTARIQYALILLWELGEANHAVDPVKVPEVAKKYDLKVEFLIQTARKMRMSGLIKSVKGRGGGYFLAADLNQLTFVELYERLQPDSKLKLSATDEEANTPIRKLYDKFISILSELKVGSK